MKRSFLTLFLALIPAALPCAAQRSNVIGVVRVAFNEPELDRPERVKEYTIGTSLMLALRQRASLPASFHARFFAGSKDELIRNAQARADTEGCVSFETQVLQVKGGVALEFYSPLTEQWLGRDGSPRTYTVVFEAGDQPNYLNIRLYYPDLASRYFADAIQIGRLARNPRGGPPEIPTVGLSGAANGGRRIEVEVLASASGRPAGRSSNRGGSALRTPPTTYPTIQRPADSRCWSARVNESQKASKASATFVTAWMIGGSCDDLRRNTVDHAPLGNDPVGPATVRPFTNSGAAAWGQ